MTHEDIKRELRALKQEMRANNVKRLSCFNGGLTPAERQYNTRLFALETKLAQTPR